MGSTERSEWVQEGFHDLTHEIRDLAHKHNQLVESVTLLWFEVQRASSDPLTKKLCTRRVEELHLMLYPLSNDEEQADPNCLTNFQKIIPSNGQTAWD